MNFDEMHKPVPEINIKLILGKGKHPDMPDMQDHDDMPDMDGCCEPDWKSIAKQLIQAISMIDSATDGAMEGDMSDEEAIKAADAMTSRILWGKQEDDNPMSSYQNANYQATTANGMVMQNPAQTFNGAAYGELDPDNDGDVDFLNGRFIDTGHDEPSTFGGMHDYPHGETHENTHEDNHGSGFRKAAEDVVQASSKKRDEVGQKPKGRFGNNSFGKPQRKPKSEDAESKIKEGEVNG